MAADLETCITLLSLEAQLELLRRINTQYWSGRIPLEWFDEFDTASDHVQTLEDLELAYFNFGTIQQNLSPWWFALSGEIEPSGVGRSYRQGEIERLHLREEPRNLYYGMRRTRINLLSHLQGRAGDSYCSIEKVMKEQGSRGLPDAEVIAALVLNQQIVTELMDGRAFPFLVLGGLLRRADCAPSIQYDGSWGRLRAMISLSRSWTPGADEQYSVPTFV